MRADARRNRQQIVATALELFAEHGPGVSMEEISRAVGLGVGTLYRHFPDRRALVEDIAQSCLTELGEYIRAQVAEDVSRWEVLLRVVRFCTGQPLAMIASLADASPRSPTRLRLAAQVDAQLTGVAVQAQEEGTLRRDITPEQIVNVLNAIVCRPGARPDDALATVMLDGLREGAR